MVYVLMGRKSRCPGGKSSEPLIYTFLGGAARDSYVPLVCLYYIICVMSGDIS